MSSFAVEVTTIDDVKVHPNADRLQLVIVKGWQSVALKCEYHTGDKVIYIPVDAMIPQDVSDEWGVTQYLSKGRVRATRLRGEVSYGFVRKYDGDKSIGDDVSEEYGITKYEPPDEPIWLRHTNHIAEHPKFHRYTDIENIKNFMNVFYEGEEVFVTEKIHGMNTRLGSIYIPRHEPLRSEVPVPNECTLMCGSHRTQRKVDPKNEVFATPFENQMVLSLIEEIRELRDKKDHFPSDIILFGEIYGKGIQDLHYGLDGCGFALFDITINSVYQDAQFIKSVCDESLLVPAVYEGPFDYNLLSDMLENDKSRINGGIIEGYVIRPMKERRDPKLGRVILKMISNQYLLRKEGTEFH